MLEYNGRISLVINKPTLTPGSHKAEFLSWGSQTEVESQIQLRIIQLGIMKLCSS